ncbi:MAG TPA: hypothetical protein VM243_19430 [Phycisphaerae bacterium]|nr:hypothetical protein [Phycisphaerae bacterium]
MDWLANHYEANGMTVHRISESALGDKHFRKMPLAEVHNQGLVRFQAWPEPTGRGNEPQVRVISHAKPLDDACRMYPAETRDVLDAYEFFFLMMERLYERPNVVDAEEPKGEAEPVNRLVAYENAIYAAAGEKKRQSESRDEFEGQQMGDIAAALLNFADGET